MKRFATTYFTALVTTIIAATSCVSEIDDRKGGEEELNGSGLILDISCEERQTRAVTDVNGDDAYNENKLDDIYYFLYREGEGDQNSVMHGVFNMGGVSSATKVIEMTEAELLNLFPTGHNSCSVLLIANYPDESRINSKIAHDSTKVDDLLSLPLALGHIFSETNYKQDLFPMVSQKADTTAGAVTLDLLSRRNNLAAKGTIKMKRVCSKITIDVHFADSATFTRIIKTNNDTTDIYNEVWRPLTPDETNESVHPLLSMTNSNTVSNVNGDAPKSPALSNYAISSVFLTNVKTTDRIYTYDFSSGSPVLTSKDVECFTSVPFYSYPQKWVYGASKSPAIKMAVNWRREAGTSEMKKVEYGTAEKPFFYKVDIPGSELPGDTLTLKSNYWYKIVLNVGILGSETDDASINLDAHFYVKSWQGTVSNEVTFNGSRYLSVPNTYYELDNLDQLKIPYTTSDPCTIKVNEAYSWNYTDSTAVKKDLTSTAAGWLSLIAENSGPKIKFAHAIDNLESMKDQSYDVSSFYISFTIQHADNPSYSQTITILQKPSIIITATPNSGDNANYGYAFVNAGQGDMGNGVGYGGYIHEVTSDSEYSNYTVEYSSGIFDYYYYFEYYLGGNPSGVSTSLNKNTSMFVIETSVLPASSTYMLGDPRSAAVDNLTANASSTIWSETANAIEGGTRTLKYYRPTARGEASDNIIAPKVRIASSYGACKPMRYDDAFRRCASYQEDGYPAGRWRVPTTAEIMYMAKLNTDGKIFRLLGDSEGSTDYWCNNGYVTVYASQNQTPEHFTGTDGKKYVRCVYDEWYWSNTEYPTVDKTKFTWGDMQ